MNIMPMNEQKILSRADGYITIDIPPVRFPTPVMAARWFATKPIMRALFFVVIGVGIGHLWHSTPPKVHPAPVITLTETLESFVVRESQELTADERKKLIAVTEKVLNDHFSTSSAMRESFRYERLRAGIDSDTFNTFSDKWTTKVEETAADSIDAMRSIYESLLCGLKMQAYNDIEEGKAGDTSHESGVARRFNVRTSHSVPRRR